MHTRRDAISLLLKSGAGVYGLHLLGGCGTEVQSASPAISWPTMDEPPILEGDRTIPWWGRGNYAPVLDEIEAFDLEVEGNIPPELNGYFVRNGPNTNTDVPDFWFFGDGMIHSVEFENGRAKSYRNRWIQTPAYETGRSSLLSNYGNTALLNQNNRLLALYEQGLPYEISLPSLETVGTFGFGDQLTGSMTAHPKVDPSNGDIHFFGYSPFPPYLRYHVASANGQMIRSVDIELPQAVMMHDFQLTENHVIFFDLPVVFRATPGSAFPITYDPSVGARFGVMPKGGDAGSVQWFEIDPCYMFHSSNAFEVDGDIIVEGCRLNGFYTDTPIPDLPAGTHWQWRLSPSSGAVTETALADIKMDFPVIDFRKQGIEQNLTYGLSLVEPNDDYPLHPNGIVRHDRTTGEMQRWASGYAAQPDEAIFVPAPGAEGEDEGWLLSMVYNRVDDVSEVVILNAQRVDAGPIAKVRMPRRVPFGFHGTWMPKEA